MNDTPATQLTVEYQYYPDPYDKEDITYFIEYSRWTGKPWQWKLCQLNFVHSKEDWEEMKKGMTNDFISSLMSNEGHPYTVGEGVVNEIEHAVDINTRQFLQFMVDSLNEKCHWIKYNEGLETAIVLANNISFDLVDNQTLVCALESSKKK